MQPIHSIPYSVAQPLERGFNNYYSIIQGDDGLKHVILGGAGFLGSNLANRLLADGASVCVFDRDGANFSHLHASQPSNLEIVKGNFGNQYPFAQLFELGDVVYHLICTTNPGLSNRDMMGEIQENVLPTLHLLDACVAKKVSKVVFISSGGTVYGRTNMEPFRETDATNPICSYGVQKLAIEKYLQIFYHISGLDYRIIRLSNPYGPLQNPKGGLGAVTAFTYRIMKDQPVTVYGDGHVIRDYIYVDDAVDGILRIAQCDNGEKLFNLGSGKGVTLIEVLQAVECALGKRANVQYGPARNVDVPYNVLDISRYRQIVSGFNPTPLEKGIRLLKESLQQYK